MEKIVLYSKIISILILFYPAWRLFSLYFKYFVNYMFCIPNNWWNPEIERPRLLFFLGGAVLIAFSQLLLYAGNTLVYILISSLLSAIGVVILYVIWSKDFEQKFISHIKTKLLGSRVHSIYAKGYDLDAILKKLTYMKCNSETFQDLLSGNRITENTRIHCALKKKQLIRFVFVVFHFDSDIPHSVVKDIVNHYFLYKNGEPYLVQDKASEISGVISEMLQEDEKFTSFKDGIIAVFQSYTK